MQEWDRSLTTWQLISVRAFPISLHTCTYLFFSFAVSIAFFSMHLENPLTCLSNPLTYFLPCRWLASSMIKSDYGKFRNCSSASKSFLTSKITFRFKDRAPIESTHIESYSIRRQIESNWIEIINSNSGRIEQQFCLFDSIRFVKDGQYRLLSTTAFKASFNKLGSAMYPCPLKSIVSPKYTVLG